MESANRIIQFNIFACTVFTTEHFLKKVVEILDFYIAALGAPLLLCGEK
jgi:hypothetical protein